MRPDAIIVGDIHLRYSNPENRKDNFFKAVAKKIIFIKELQEEYQVPVLQTGDIFDQAKVSQKLESWCFKNLPYHMFNVAGNHDLDNHNINYLDDTSLGVLYNANRINLLYKLPYYNYMNKFIIKGFNWKEPISNESYDYDPNIRKIAILHSMVYYSDPIKTADGIIGTNYKHILKKLKNFDLVIVGHNHKHFIGEYEGRKLLNVGSLTRTNIDQIDYKPRIFFWYAKHNRLEPINIPFEKDVFNTEKVNNQKKIDQKIISLVEKLDNNINLDLNFKNNLQKYMSLNNIEEEIQEEALNSLS